MVEISLDLKDLLFRCKACSWYSGFKDLKFVKEAMKYRRFFSCPKCSGMNFIVHLKTVEKKAEENLTVKHPKGKKVKGNDSQEEEK